MIRPSRRSIRRTSPFRQLIIQPVIGFKNSDGCDNGNNIPPMTSMSYHPGGVNAAIRRWLGAFHQELDQLMELDEHHARYKRRRCEMHDPGRYSARGLAVALHDQWRRGAQLRPVLIISGTTRRSVLSPRRT